MRFELWYLVVGVVLTVVALLDSHVRRLPITQSILFLVVGLLCGPWVGIGAIRMDPIDQSHLIERLTEIGVIVSLFGAGMKLRTPIWAREWLLPVSLASIAMVITIAGVTAVGYFVIGLPRGVAVLLGAILAPTDPVLASDVQVEHPTDRDRVRFGLTGEAGLNDGTAFPFVMLGLGLMGLHELGEFGWRWLAVDLLWMIVGGLTIGAVLGSLVGRLILHLRQTRKESVGTDDFLAIGLLASAYGAALMLHTYGFLAAFAAGLALRRVEVRAMMAIAERSPQVEAEALRDAESANVGTEGGEAKNEVDGASPGEQQLAIDVTTSTSEQPAASDVKHAPAYMAVAVLSFIEKAERLAEVGLVILLGGMLMRSTVSWHAVWFVPAMFLLVRPIAVYVTTRHLPLNAVQRRLIAWCGIRGIGSIYYLMYAINHGVPKEHAGFMVAIVFTTVAVSITVHGISVTPLMAHYRARHAKPAPVA